MKTKATKEQISIFRWFGLTLALISLAAIWNPGSNKHETHKNSFPTSVKAETTILPTSVPRKESPVQTPQPVPTEIITPLQEDIKSVWGEGWTDAYSVLKWKDVNGNIHGENTRLISKNIDVSNEGYDIGKNFQEAPGDILGKDNLWHSQDRGLFRINSRNFSKSEFNRMKTSMEKVGIDTTNSQTAWDDMNNQHENIEMAYIIWHSQGWCAWFAAPPTLCSNNYSGIEVEK